MADGSTSTLTNPVTGTGTTNYLPKWTSGTAIGNSLVYDNGTNVGIGTTNPVLPLTIFNSNAATLYQTSGTGTGGGNGFYVGHTGNVSYVFNYNAFPIQFGTNNLTRMTLDSTGNLGLGVTPSAYSLGKVVEVGTLGNAFWGLGINSVQLTSNYFYDGSYKYANNGYANRYDIGSSGGSHIWFNAPSGTAGNTISFTQAMTLDASGRLGLGTTSPSVKLDVGGASNVESQARFFKTSEGTLLLGGNRDTSNCPFIGSQNNFDFALITNATERLRITSGGNLLVGTTTDTGERLQVTGALICTTGFTVSGNGGIANGANRFNLDYFSGNARLYSLGVNTSTKGGFEFHTNSSDGSIDVIAFNIKNTGIINIANVPTSSVGLSAGDVYSSAGVLMIV
jgi:hypothetical protein